MNTQNSCVYEDEIDLKELFKTILPILFMEFIKGFKEEEK